MLFQLQLAIRVLRNTKWLGRKMKGWNLFVCYIVQVSVLLQKSDAVNVALGKPAYQTDTWNGTLPSTADLAVDGNTSPDRETNKSCAHTLSYNTSWWVNLQQIFFIRSVKIYNRQSFSYRLTDVELYVGFSERGFQSREGFHPGQVDVSYTFELDTPVFGQWVRITRRTSLDVLTLCEVEVEGVPYAASNDVRYEVFKGYVHTGTAIDVSGNVRSKLDCTSRCPNTKNCISTHYNKATLTCSLFDDLAFKQGDVNYDVIAVNSIAITETSRAQLFET